MKFSLFFAVLSMGLTCVIASKVIGQNPGFGSYGGSEPGGFAAALPEDELPNVAAFPAVQIREGVQLTPIAPLPSVSYANTAWGNFHANSANSAFVTVYSDGKFAIVDRIEASEPEERELLVRQSQEGQRVLQEAMMRLKSDSATEAEREEAKKVLTQYLDIQFDADHQRRVKQLKSLEEQVATLKAQLDKRESSKQRLIELRLTLLENDANGLGFPSGWNVSSETLPQAAFGTWTTSPAGQQSRYVTPGFQLQPPATSSGSSNVRSSR